MLCIRFYRPPATNNTLFFSSAAFCTKFPTVHLQTLNTFERVTAIFAPVIPHPITADWPLRILHRGPVTTTTGTVNFCIVNNLVLSLGVHPFTSTTFSNCYQRHGNENLDDWSLRPAVINETVLVAKEFLDGELAKYDDWNHAGKNTRMIFASNSQFQNCKQEGIGHGTILKFLVGN